MEKNIFLHFYLIAIEIGGFAGANVGDNESSFGNDHVRPSGNGGTTIHLADACEANESASCNANDNALVAFWHPARAERKKPSLSLELPTSTGYIAALRDWRSGGLYEEPRRRRARAHALNSNETIRPLEKARQGTNAGRRERNPLVSARRFVWNTELRDAAWRMRVRGLELFGKFPTANLMRVLSKERAPTTGITTVWKIV